MKKSIVLSAFCLFLVLFLASAVSAAADITIGDVTLGDSNQERSIPNSRDVTKQHVRVSSQNFLIENKGDVNLTNVQLKIKSIAYQSKYKFNIQFDGRDSDANNDAVNLYTVPLPGDVLIVGGSVNVAISAEVVADLDAVDLDLKEVAQKIAVLEVSAAQEGAPEVTDTDPGDLSMQAENKLTVKDVEVCVSGENCDSNINDGDNVEDVKPGDGVDIEIVVENRFSDSRNNKVDIEDVEVRFNINDEDVDEDEQEDLDDLSPRDEDSVKFDIDIDDDADGNVEAIVEVEGTTEFGALMGERISFDLEINRQNHEVKIDAATVNPSALSCGITNTVTVRADIQNIGKSDEDDASLKVSSERLGITEQFIRNIQLDEDDRISRSFTFTVPGSVRAGVYSLLVESFYDRDEFSDSKDLTLSVPDCGAEGFGPGDFGDQNDRDEDDRNRDEEDEDAQDEDEQRDRPVVVIQQPPQPPVVQQPPVVSAQPQPAPRKTTSGNSGVIVGVLVGLIVLLLIVGIILVVAIATKKPRY